MPRSTYSKIDAEKYLYENSRVTIGQITFESQYGYPGGGSHTIRDLAANRGIIMQEWADLEDKPETTVPIMGFPGLIHIVVTGDPYRNKAMVFYTVYNRPITREIGLPADWDQLTQ